MKKFTLISVALLATFALFTANALAIPISGGIDFTGEWGLVGGGSDLLMGNELTFSDVKVEDTSGDFSVISEDTPATQFNNIKYNPVTFPISPLWEVGDFQFDLTYFYVDYIASDVMILRGTGMAIDNTGYYSNTSGSWKLSANTSGSTFSFSSSNSVPDASLMLLLGPALVGLGIVGRRKK
jgi:hypothetical protein